METLKIYERKSSPYLTSPYSVYEELKDIKDCEKELFIVFLINTRKKVISREIINIGILDASVVHPREVFRTAIIRNCHSIIIAHNHPSGDPKPSNEDLDITKQLAKAGDILGIKLLDHVICADDEFISLRRESTYNHVFGD